jgi:energy-coupling factor transporter ATP-binding protein EcfA2
MSGSSLFDPDADWVDYEAAGLSGPEDVLNTAIEVLRFVNLDEDVYQLGLRASIDPERTPELAARALDARRAMAGRFESDPQLGRLVEVFDPERYNTNATLAENLLFGTPVGDDFKIDNLAEHPYVIEIIEECGLVDDLRQVGFKLASTMVELFADLPPDHEYFRQFSFINPEDLPDYKTLLSRADPSNLEALPEADRQRLLSLPFKLAPARHRLGLIDDALQSRVLDARRLFREKLPERFTKSIAFFDPDQYNPAATLQDNILFGRIAYGQAQAAQKISELIAQVLDDLGMHGEVVAAGLEAEVGVGGSRLSLPQRQKLALGRAIMKQPEVLIFFEPTGALDPVEQTDLMRRILERFADRTVIWGLQRTDQAPHFGRVLVMREGRIVEQGSYDELNREGTALRTMIAAA